MPVRMIAVADFVDPSLSSKTQRFQVGVGEKQILRQVYGSDFGRAQAFYPGLTEAEFNFGTVDWAAIQWVREPAAELHRPGDGAGVRWAEHCRRRCRRG
jgi:hypothetical protein